MRHRETRPPDRAGAGGADGAPAAAGSPGAATDDARPADGREPEAVSDDAGPEGDASADAAASEDPGAAAREQTLRLAAEFDNFKKRVARERTETWSRAQAGLLEKLLPALDDRRRVVDPADAGPLDGPAAALLDGVSLVQRNVLSVLERAGLAEIPAEGQVFDPAVHEAVLTESTDDPGRDGRVAGVLQRGYRFGDRLLRPAQVVVWKLRD
jgi:molecular chaperone GrpE